MISALQIIFLVSLLGTLYVLFSKITILLKVPRVSSSDSQSHSSWQSFFKKFYQSKVAEYFIDAINLFEKFLRKLRIIFLKIDNLVTRWIYTTREKSQIFTVRYLAWLSHHKTKRVRVAHRAKEMLIGTEVVTKKEEDANLLDKEDVDLKILEQKYIKLLSENPKNLEVYKKLGDLYLGQRSYGDAREVFLQLLKLKPEDKEAIKKLDKINEKLRENN